MADSSRTPEKLTDATNEFNGSDNKRKREENGNAQQQQSRAKRNRYTSIACNECKRRKIKCNGETPCQRCGNLLLDCIYAPNCCSNNFKDTMEFKQMHAHIVSLQDQVNVLWDSLNSLRAELGHEIPAHVQDIAYGSEQGRATSAPQASMVIDPALNRSKAALQQSRFQGPTSSAYSFGLARSSLAQMGVTSNEDGQDIGENTRDVTPTQSPKLAPTSIHPSLYAIAAITKDEALRLCQVYEDEMGLMYPILDINRILQYATLIFGLGDAAIKRALIVKGTGDPVEDPELDLLRLILAIALVCEGSGQTELAKKLYDGTSYIREDKIEGTIDIKRIQIMTLAAMYHFHTDDEGLSWRIIGVAARACLELGLHRSETYTKLFQDEQDRTAALKLFWSVYVLDRRWSFGTGMSFALSDADIDSALPKPNESSPYLAAMIDYSSIGSKVWETIAKASADSPQKASSKDQMSYLDYQIKQWYENLPESLKYVHPKSQQAMQHRNQNPNDPEAINANGGRALHRLRIVLYLRLNQMRILIHRTVLHSATNMATINNGTTAQMVVDIAKDTINILTHVNQTSDIYRAQQMCFNYFLVSALGVLFLAVSHAPAQFSANCRDEFYMALDLVRGLSVTSVVSDTLWRTIRGLKNIGPKLGLYARSSEQTENGSYSQSSDVTRLQHDGVDHRDTQNSAAMAMATLAGHNIDENAFFAASHQGGNPASSNGTQMANGKAHMFSPQGHNRVAIGMADNLASLFEAAGAMMGNTGASSVGVGGDAVNEGSVIQGNGQAANSAGVAGSSSSQGGGGIGMAYGNEEEFGRIMEGLFYSS